MDPLFNPFSPGAGSPPPELAGRDDILEQARVTLGRIKLGRSEPSLMLVGLRGVGKTVLLNRIQALAEAMEYKTVMIEATESKPLPAALTPALRQILFQLDVLEGVSDKVKRGFRVLRAFVGAVKLSVSDVELGVDVDPEKGSADSGDLEADLAELFLAIGEAAKDRGKALCILVDEVQYLSEKEMSALIMAIHKVSQRQLPLVLVGGGLPQLVGLAGRSKSYAERLFRYPAVGPLPRDEAVKAIQGPVQQQQVSFESDALDELIAVTQGYPYFLQEWGYNAWNLAKVSPITIDVVKASTSLAVKKLDESFFRVRLDRLTPREKEYMRALAHFGPGAHRSGDIAACLGAKVESIAPLRSGLIKKGMIYSPAHGDTQFTVPLFDQFMKRTMPDWQAKRPRK